MPFRIALENNKYTVYGIDDNGNTFLTQLFNPFTGSNFVSIDECITFLKLVMGAKNEQIVLPDGTTLPPEKQPVVSTDPDTSISQ